MSIGVENEGFGTLGKFLVSNLTLPENLIPYTFHSELLDINETYKINFITKVTPIPTD